MTYPNYNAPYQGQNKNFKEPKKSFKADSFSSQGNEQKLLEFLEQSGNAQMLKRKLFQASIIAASKKNPKK